MKTLRRYEILVPLLFDDGSAAVSGALLAQTFAELRAKFGAVSRETQPVHGSWEHQGVSYRDLTRFFVDVPDLPEYVNFFRDFKQTLKQRFDPVEFWIISYLWASSKSH